MSTIKNMTPCPVVELMSCPGCGHTDISIRKKIIAGVGARWVTKCFSCHMSGPVTVLRETAVDKWNRFARMESELHRIRLLGIAPGPTDIKLAHLIEIAKMAVKP